MSFKFNAILIHLYPGVSTMKHVYCAWFLICLASIYIKFTLADEVIPERAEVDYVNEKYASYIKTNVRRTGRRSPYYANFYFKNLFWMDNNVTFYGIFYEFLHNEYKRSFVELEGRYCDLLTKEPWYSFFGKTARARGLTCPLPPNAYKLENVSWSLANFPYVWPFEKVMIEWSAKMAPAQEIIARGRFYITFKRAIPKGKEDLYFRSS